MEQQTEQEKSQELMIWPASILTKKAEPVTEFTPELTQDIIDLHNSLRELNGLGLSACQVGDPRAYFVFKVGDREGVMINPKIIADSSTMKHESNEGCLSFPGIYVKVERFNHITVQYQDEDGVQHEEEIIGLLGDCVQHEIDHLNGRTLMNSLSRLKQDIVKRKMVKLQKKINRIKKVDKNVERRAFKAPADVDGTGVTLARGGRDTGVHRVHLSSE